MSKTSKKPLKHSKKKKTLPLITLKPKHRITSHGTVLSWHSSQNFGVRAMVNGYISQKQQQSIIKTLKSKGFRRTFRFRGIPFYELTKKPSEVRMGKGRGTRIYSRILPFSPGQIIGEIDCTQKQRTIFKVNRFLKAIKYKLPFKMKIMQLDL
jgi:ribosomal protein L16/L10AE